MASQSEDSPFRKEAQIPQNLIERRVSINRDSVTLGDVDSREEDDLGRNFTARASISEVVYGGDNFYPQHYLGRRGIFGNVMYLEITDANEFTQVFQRGASDPEEFRAKLEDQDSFVKELIDDLERGLKIDARIKEIA